MLSMNYYNSPYRDLFEEYIATFTNEGYGVIHVVFVGTYIPFEWIQEKWKKIHCAFQVNI